MKRWSIVLLAAAIALLAFELYRIERLVLTGASDRESYAATASRTTVLCNACTGTGAQAAKRVDGGESVFQVTCLTSGGNTWPDSIALEARDSEDHTWVAVQGFVAATADGRQANLFGFAPNSWARIVITDAAGSHSCYATLAGI